MQMNRLAHEADFTFAVEGFTGELRVLSFGGEEGVSRLFGFGIQLASDDGEIDIDSIVGQPATLTIYHENGERKIHGIVSRFEQSSEGTDFTPYYAELVPQVWLLTQRYGCRIHQNLSVPDIVRTVLTDAGTPNDRFRFTLNAEYPEQEYCVQYRESDWNFVSRLLEEVGIFYFFEHTDEACNLVMADSDTAHEAIETPDTIPFREASGTVAEEEAIFTFRYSQQIRPGKVTYRDYDFEKPSLDLEKDETAQRDDALEMYDYPGLYIDPDVGQNRVLLGLESIQTRRVVGIGQSLCRRFIPGYKFNLDEHPRSDFNRDYVLIWVSHTGTQPHGEAAVGGQFEYNNEFRCIPGDIPFRPARRTPRPVIQGTQTAVVTGPSGEEIYPDKYGRVKVQFHWDREGQNDENSSCWVRVSQVWAGNSWGAMYIPRIGQEVIIDFLEGDPDKPLITGRLYRGDNMPPYKLPDDKTKSTIKSDSSKGGGGYNEIRFEDLKGKEEIFLHGQKDWTIAIENDKNQTVGNNETLAVGSNRTKTVGTDQSETIGNNKTIQVGTNHTETIGANMTLTVGSNKSETVAVNTTETVGVAKALTIGAAYQVTVGGAMNESVGAAKAVEIGGAKTVLVGGSNSLNVGGEMAVLVGGAYVLKASKVIIEAKDEITLKTGGAMINMKSGGDITIKGSKINIKASGNMVLKGSKIAEN